MGKIRTRIIGLEDIEQQQKEEQKKRSQEKKLQKKAEEGTEEATTEETKEVKKVVKKAEAKESKKQVRGAKYLKAAKSVDANKYYTVEEAVELLKKIKFAGFDESVELHLNVDKEGLKGEVELPFTMGKTLRIKIADEAVLEKLESGIIEFDVLVAHPSFMPKLAKYARILGPKGLMPNPKSGTVSPTPEEVVKKFEKGVLRFKGESKFPLLHQMISKISADDHAIVQNAKAFVAAVGKAHITAITMKTTMSPAIKLDLEKV